MKLETFYDLFGGIGGFRLSLETNGFKCVGSCEIDKHAREIYRKNFGEYPSEMDATKIKPEELPDFDILCAGFPCQTFSIAGRKLGFEESRGTLFFEIARIARQKRPKLLLLENVKGLLHHDRGKTLTVILSTLDELGYDAEWQVINSKYFVPQNRERIFIIGHLRGLPSRKIFPIGEIGQEYDRTQDKTQSKRPRLRSQISGAIDANYSKGGGSRTFVMLTETRTEEAKKTRRESAREGRDWSPRRGKELVPRTDNMANCVTATQSNERFLTDGAKIRALTPLECERLQGFPDGWTEGIADTHRYKVLGNAITVPVVQYIAKHLK